MGKLQGFVNREEGLQSAPGEKRETYSGVEEEGGERNSNRRGASGQLSSWRMRRSPGSVASLRSPFLPEIPFGGGMAAREVEEHYQR